MSAVREYGPFSAQPPAEPGWHLSMHRAPVTYAAFATEVAWMWSWQAAQDDEGLAPHLRHEGCPRWLARPGFSEVGEPGDLVDCHRRAVLA
jgi:hypothetical protein